LKIIDVTEFYSDRGGGIRSHLTTRGHFLCQRNHDHLVLAPGRREEDAVTGSNVAQGGTGRSRIVRFAGPALPYDRTYHLLGRLDKVRQRIQSEQPDVIEAHSPYLATAAVLGSRNRRAQVTTAFWHTDHVGTYIEPALEARLGNRLTRAVARPLWSLTAAVLAAFDGVFVAGRAQADRLRSAGVRSVVFAPFGVDTAIFHPLRRSEAWRRRWLSGTREGVPLLIGAGRFAYEKRWDVVIQAFAQVRSRREALLVLYGDGPERERLEQMAPEGVHFAGFEKNRPSLAAALASADILVHAGPYETFGLGIAEAVACGLPVVVPDAGGAVQSVDPSCGETYRSLDPAACAAAIHMILDRNPEELRHRALEAAGRVHTAEKHFDIILSTYDDLSKEKHDHSLGR
jgi:alpha-1,6-mannosyltransferase